MKIDEKKSGAIFCFLFSLMVITRAIERAVTDEIKRSEEWFPNLFSGELSFMAIFIKLSLKFFVIVSDLSTLPISVSEMFLSCGRLNAREAKFQFRNID